jgi:hypothetical protein
MDVPSRSGGTYTSMDDAHKERHGEYTGLSQGRREGGLSSKEENSTCGDWGLQAY